MKDFLNFLVACCEQEGQSLTADTVLQRWQEVRRQTLVQPLADNASTTLKCIAPHLRKLHRELSGTSDGSEDEIDGSPPSCTPEEWSRKQQQKETSRQCSSEENAVVKSILPAVVNARDDAESGIVSPATTLRIKALQKMSKAELRNLVSHTPGISRNKQTSAGNWIPKIRAELVAELSQIGEATQSLTGGGLSADAKKKTRQQRKKAYKKTEPYKEKRRLLERTAKYRLAQNSRRKGIEHKEKKRAYENSSKAKSGRLLRKRLKFWTPCLFNFSCIRNNKTIRASSSLAPFAPRLHPDGRISVLQHGLAKFLPCPDEPHLPSCIEDCCPPSNETVYHPTRVEGGRVLNWVGHLVKVPGRMPAELESHQSLTVKTVRAAPLEDATLKKERRRVFSAIPRSQTCRGKEYFPRFVPGSWQRHRAPLMYYVLEVESETSVQCLERLQAFFGDCAEIEEMTNAGTPRGLPPQSLTKLLRELDSGTLSDKAYDGGQEKIFFTLRTSTSLKGYSRCMTLKTQVLEQRVPTLTPPEEKRLAEFNLALALRCRIGTINAARVEASNGQGCTETRCVHNKRLKRYAWKCPMAAWSGAKLYEAAVLDECDSLPRGFFDPPPQIRQFLCNRRCPLRCCTLKCPWNSWDLGGAGDFTRRLWGTGGVTRVAEARTIRDWGQFQPTALFPCSCGLQGCRFCEAEGLSRNRYAETCLQDPPPPGFVLYRGCVEPVSDSSPSQYSPALYVLTCRRWRMVYSMIGPTHPSFNPVRQRHWQQCMEGHGYQPADFVYDNFCRDKAYDKPRWCWTVEQGRQWDSEAVPVQDEGPESGVEWRWEEVSKLFQEGAPQPPHVEFPSVGARCADAGKELVTELPNTGSLARQFSLRCVFCSYVHGSPPFGGRAGHDGHMPPQDVAIRVAQALVVLASLWHGRQHDLDAGLILRCAAQWKRVVKFLDSASCSPHQPAGQPAAEMTAQQGPTSDVQFPFDKELGALACVIPLWAQDVAKSCFISYVAAVRQDLHARVSRALHLQGQQEAIDNKSRIERTTGTHCMTQVERRKLLSKYGFASPIFAAVDAQRPPRLTLAATSDCKCLVPWADRSMWERLCSGLVRYELPLRASLWQPIWVSRRGQYVWTFPQRWDDVAKTLHTCIGKRELTDHCMALFGHCCCFSDGSGPSMGHAQAMSVNKSVLQVGCNTSVVMGRDVAPASGSEGLHPSSQLTVQTEGDILADDLVPWASESDGNGSECSAESAMDSDEQIDKEDECEVGLWDAEEQEGGESSSESLDVDPVESGDVCPATPPARYRPAADTAEKTNPFLGGDVMCDSSSDIEHEPYCNEGGR